MNFRTKIATTPATLRKHFSQVKYSVLSIFEEQFHIGHPLEFLSLKNLFKISEALFGRV
jgi:hypothetical protein